MTRSSVDVEEAGPASFDVLRVRDCSIKRTLDVVGEKWTLLVLRVVAGGLLGTVVGSRANAVLAQNKERLSRLFAWFVVAAGLYVAGRGALSLLAGSTSLRHRYSACLHRRRRYFSRRSCCGTSRSPRCGPLAFRHGKPRSWIAGKAPHSRTRIRIWR